MFSGWGMNTVLYKGSYTPGNEMFQNNQIVRLEFDSEKGTLTFFLDEVQQPVYFSGIKEKVRFIIYMKKIGSSCIIRSLNKLVAPTVKQLEEEKEIKW
ncbi:MAG: hypothetical protein EZS28_049417 [Streblomastix strix]|uniref:B30.2/SPRY domain-containing protein n=1 Tax=Streblomastix strix TaxID=222440 RepID=A0A5J4T9C9_9EUKA|nr:MAG: hypothetical protein EZS28_049417 [Streblomastix strix]